MASTVRLSGVSSSAWTVRSYTGPGSSGGTCIAALDRHQGTVGSLGNVGPFDADPGRQTLRRQFDGTLVAPSVDQNRQDGSAAGSQGDALRRGDQLQGGLAARCPLRLDD